MNPGGVNGGRAEPVGILGGTFDPAHLGHIHAAEWARRVFSFRRILLVPCDVPPHKTRDDLTPASHRLAMLRLAAEARDWLDVDTVELERGGSSYTIDTLRILAARRPGVAPVFIMGGDSLAEIHTWRLFRELIREFDLVCVERGGFDLGAVRKKLETVVSDRIVEVPGEAGGWPRGDEPPLGSGGRVLVTSIPPVAVSSSQVRAAAASGEPLDGLVPPLVARYIDREGLYRQHKEQPLIPELTECVEAARDKKAEDIVVLDLRGLSDITDFFVICHGTSDRQVAAIAESVEERLSKNLQREPGHVEGKRLGEWILLDYFDVVVHVFLDEKRKFYGLDRLWGDAPRVEMPTPPDTATAGGSG